MKDYLVNPVVLRSKVTDKSSIYEAIVAMGHRARQINDDIKMQLQARMQHISPIDDDNEFGNYDQLEISKEFDKIPKPTFLAMKEMYNGQINYDLHLDLQAPPDDEKPKRKRR